MSESDTIFSSQVKHKGIFDFKELYKFCYDWLLEETSLDGISEVKYVEKLEGNTKNIDIEWDGVKKITDFFMFKFKIKFKVAKLEKVEINKGGIKINTNKGAVGISVKGILVRDYQGKFENSAFQIFLRTSYEKWIIPNRIDQMEGKLFGDCEEFLSQVKAFLDLEGRT